MNTKITLLLLLAALGLMAFIELYEKKQASSANGAGTDDFVLAFDRNEVTGLVIASNEDRIELRSHGNRWEMLAPVKDRADQNVVAEILTRCEILRKEATLSGKAVDQKKLEDFGVAKANLRLKLTGPHMPPEISFGKETAVEGKTYLRLEGSDTVYVTGDDLRTLLARKADDFRDRRLTECDAKHTTRFSVKTVAGEIEAARKADHWQLTKPLEARADDRKVSDVADAVLGLQIVAFIPDKGANLNNYGLVEPRTKITFWTVTEDKPLILELGAQDPKTGNTYGRLSGRDAIYLLPKGIEKLTSLVPDELRDRHLLRVDLDIVDRLTIETANQPKVVLQRRNEEWLQIEGAATRPVNGARVQEFVKALQSREIGAFVTDVASDLPKYGLDRPQLRVTFASYSSENTAETSAGEHPFLTVDFGSTDGNDVFARVADEPFIVSVDKSFVDELAAGPVQWRPLTVLQLKPQEIVLLEVAYAVDGSAATRTALSLIRTGTAWAPAPNSSPAAVNATQVQSLVNTLAGLKAVRWNAGGPPIVAGPGSETIAFKTAKGPLHKLLLAAPAPDGTCSAQLEGDSASFVVSAPDESALRLKLSGS